MRDLDDFTVAYIEAALWSTNDESTPEGGVPLDENYSADDLSDEALDKIVADCAKFQAENAADIDAGPLRRTGCTASEQAGHDFWLTRNGHGCGFWEPGDWPNEAGQRMDKASKAFGECTIYVGDDGKLYL